jgi:hypothetical protein
VAGGDRSFGDLVGVRPALVLPTLDGCKPSERSEVAVGADPGESSADLVARLLRPMGEIVLRLGVCVREERADLTVLVASCSAQMATS